MTHILVIDDHPIVREAVAGAIHALMPEASILDVGSAGEACSPANRQKRLDAILLDLVLPDTSGLDGLIAIRSHFPRVPVLVFTALDDPRIASEALALGASGYVPKTVSKATLVEAIVEVLSGDTYVGSHDTLPAARQPGLQRYRQARL